MKENTDFLIFFEKKEKKIRKRLSCVKSQIGFDIIIYFIVIQAKLTIKKWLMKFMNF